MKLKYSILAVSLLGMVAVPCMAAVSVFGEYHLGETGSIVSDLPQDSIGTNHFTGQFGTVVTGSSSPAAPGSTDYLSTSANGFYNASAAGLTGDWAIGIFARQTIITSDQTLFMTDGVIDGPQLKIQIGTDGWASSVNNVAWVGNTQGTTGSAVANTWVHLALISRAGSVGFYIDGVDQGSRFDNTGGSIALGDLHIGTDENGSKTFTGDLDELRLATFSGDSDAAVISALTAVPEPSSAALLGLGGLALILRRRK